MLYLLFGKLLSKHSNDENKYELYKIFDNKKRAEEYKKECEKEDIKRIFIIEEWEITK